MEWREIATHKGKYEVSDKGQVRNTKKDTFLATRGLLKSVQLSPYTYPALTPMCQLVAQAFVENPNHYKSIRFKNGIRDNRPSNLEWVKELKKDDVGYTIPDSWYFGFRVQP